MKLEFSPHSLEKAQVSNLMKVCRVRTELLQVEGNSKRGRNDEANNRFRTFANVPKNGWAFIYIYIYIYIYMCVCVWWCVCLWCVCVCMCVCVCTQINSVS